MRPAGRGHRPGGGHGRAARVGGRLEWRAHRHGQWHREPRCHRTRRASHRHLHAERWRDPRDRAGRERRRAEPTSTRWPRCLCIPAASCHDTEGSMVLTGRRALEASGSVSAEDESAIGGYERIMGPNGEAQFLRTAWPRRSTSSTTTTATRYVVPGEAGRGRSRRPIPRRATSAIRRWRPNAASTSRRSARSSTTRRNPGRKRPFAMRAVMAAVVDVDGGHLERWHGMVGGETAIVWDAHLGGRAVELIGIESHTVDRDGYRPIDGPEAWNGGTLFPYRRRRSRTRSTPRAATAPSWCSRTSRASMARPNRCGSCSSSTAPRSRAPW